MKELLYKLYGIKKYCLVDLLMSGLIGMSLILGIANFLDKNTVDGIIYMVFIVVNVLGIKYL